MKLDSEEKRKAYATWFAAWWRENFSISGPCKGTFYQKNRDTEIQTFPLHWKGESRQYPNVYYPLFDGDCNPTAKHPEFDAKGIFNESDLLALCDEDFFREGFFKIFRGGGSEAFQGCAAGIVFPESISLGKVSEIEISMQYASLPNVINSSSIYDTTSRWRNANFRGGLFPFGAKFQAIDFRGYASFEDSAFLGDVIFYNTLFSGQARFLSAEFCELASFDGAEFSSTAEFDSAVFRKTARFRGYAKQVVSDQPPNQFHSCSFQKSEFRSEAIFNNRIFRDHSDFSSAKFYLAPRFHKCELHQDTSFPDRDGFCQRYSSNGNDENKSIERAYRTLRLEMEKVGSRNEEVMFHAFELEARSHRRDSSVSRMERFFIRIYGFVSDYGQSLRKPLELLVWLTGLGMTVFIWLAVLATASKKLTAANYDFLGAGQEILIFSLKQVFRPFHIWGDGFDRYIVSDAAPIWLMAVNESYPFLLRIAASIESLFAVILIGLFFIVLRRKFQLS